MDPAQADSAERRLRRENSAQGVLQAALIVAMVALLVPPLDPALPPPPSAAGVNADAAAAATLTIPLLCCSAALVAIVCLIVCTAINWIESASAELVRDHLCINYVLILLNIAVRLLLVMQSILLSFAAAVAISGFSYVTLHLTAAARSAAPTQVKQSTENVLRRIPSYLLLSQGSQYGPPKHPRILASDFYRGMGAKTNAPALEDVADEAQEE